MSSTSLKGVRIGIVTWDVPPYTGGLGRAMTQWHDELVRLGANVHVLSPETDIVLSVTKTLGKHLLMSLLLPFLLQRFIDRHSLDVLLVPGGPGGLFLFRKPKHCVVITLFYHLYSQQARDVPGERWKRIFLPLERKLLKRSDRIWCFSEDAEKKICEEARGTSPLHITQSFDALAWRPPTNAERDPNLCVCVARLDARKGIDVLLRAWKIVAKRNPAARLMVVGDGVMRREVEVFIKDHPSVQCIDHLLEKDLRQLMWRSSIALCPSYLEGFGFACVEGMASGAAVIASDSDGLRSLVQHERTGFLVAPGNAEALASAIVDLLAHPVLRSSIALEAQKYVEERFRPDRTARELQEAILAVCSDR